MSTYDRELGMRPSVLDRLIDLEPKSSSEAPNSNYGSLGDVKNAVRRDLEWLLNTRRMVSGLAGDLQELKKSIVNYGIPDITGVDIENKMVGKTLRHEIEEAIRTFEPRFLDVSVTMEPVSATDRQIRLRIEAKLDVDPVPEPMVFDTVLQLGSSTVALNESN